MIKSPFVDPCPSELRSGRTIAGVKLMRLDRNEDDRGAFTEVFCAEWPTGIDPTQWSLVESRAGVLRGMHLHRRHDEYFMVISGRATVGLHDLRAGSPTYGHGSTYELTGPDCFLSFPRGLVHGWLFHERSLHLQAVSESYVNYGSDDNHGCRWDDPELGIDWPFAPTELSPRAAGFPSLRSLRESI